MLGVLGGMGPAATIEFASRLVANTPATCDQEHIPMIIWNDPRVPDRSTAMLAGTNEPLPWLKRGIRGLQQAGCDHIVIPCNTAHFWYDELSKLGTPITHIVDAVANQLQRLNVTGRIVVLGTQATLNMGLYQNRLTNWECVSAANADQVQRAIDLIKAGYIEDGYKLVAPVIQTAVQEQAQAVVLGCTELPLAVRQQWWGETPIVNSIDALVSAVITC